MYSGTLTRDNTYEDCFICYNLHKCIFVYEMSGFLTLSNSVFWEKKVRNSKIS